MVNLHSHDYNAELGDIDNLRSFEEKFPEEFQYFEKGLIKYMRYVEELESGTIVEEPKRQSAKTLMELETDDTGYPLLPSAVSDPTKDRLEYQKRLIRSFLTNHYRKWVHFPRRRLSMLILLRVCLWPAGGEISMAIVCLKAN